MKKETITIYTWFCPACGCENKTLNKNGVCLACGCNSSNYDFFVCGHVIEIKGKSKFSKCSTCLTTNS